MLSARPQAVVFDVDGPSRAVSLAKTPAKGLSTRARGENLRTGTKGKVLQPKHLFKDAGVKPPTVAVSVPSRPLLDKTPFQNRTRDFAAFHTPLPPTKLDFLDPESDGTPLLFPRSSSTRKHIRVPRSASRSFETPPNRIGIHPWDVSELDICLTHEQPSIVEDVAEEDHDEIEYMPPRPVEGPYCPPFDFDLPNYKELGATLFELTRSYPIDDGAPNPLDQAYKGEFLELPAEWSFPLPELDSDNDSSSQKRLARTMTRSAPRIPANSMGKGTTKSVGPQHRSRPQPAPRSGSRAQGPTRAMSARAPSESTSRSRTGAGSVIGTRSTTSAGQAKRDALAREVRGVSGARTTSAAGSSMRATKTAATGLESDKSKVSAVARRRPATSASLNRIVTAAGKKKSSELGKGDDEVIWKATAVGPIGEDFLFDV